MYKGLIETLAQKNDARILLAVIDGLGDIGIPQLQGMTPLEAADTPNMDGLAGEGALGMHVPVAMGITPGSGPAHLGLFGYDPVENRVGRGVLSALGVGFELQHGDLAARINFCTVDSEGVVTDRRAGRISTEKCTELVGILKNIRIEGVEIFVMPVKEHRACVVFRGGDFTDEIHDTDPGLVGRKPVAVTGSDRSHAVVREFLDRAAELLLGHHPANCILMRGFALHREMKSMGERYLLNPSAVALYPMYRGVASLVGMRIIDTSPQTIEGEVLAVGRALALGHDFVFLHHKPADSSGEDGDYQAKIRAIEEFDRYLPEFIAHGFDVVCVTGDHSTPCPMKLHSWHPVPVLIHGGPQRTGTSSGFSEREAISGTLGSFRAVDIMPLLLASAGKLSKFGA